MLRWELSRDFFAPVLIFVVLTAGDHGALLLNPGRYYCLKFLPSQFSTQQIKYFSVIHSAGVCMTRCALGAVLLLDSRGAKVRQPQFPLPVCCRMAEASLLPWPVPFLTLCPALFGFCLPRCCPACAPSCQDGVSEAPRRWLGLGDRCRLLLHPVPVLRVTAGRGSALPGVAGCFWRRERQDCLGWIASKWNWIACQ